MNIMIIVITFVVLAIHTIEDVKNKQINMKILLTGMLIITFMQLYVMETGLLQYFASLIPGFFMVLASKPAAGHIGGADGYVLCFTGISVGLWANIGVILCGFILLWVFCAVGMIVGKFDRKQTVPLVPFIMAGYTICLLMT